MFSMIKRINYSKLITDIQRGFCSKKFNDNNDINLPIKNIMNCNNVNTKKWSSDNQIQYKFHPETESAFNHQMNAEFEAFYNYLSMASYFGRVDVALPGCESFFMQMHNEEREHALKFFNYIKMRGGLIKLYSIHAPINQDWKCPLDAFKAALELEISISNKLITANLIAEKHNDLNACDFIVTKFMDEQMRSINELDKFITVLSSIGDESLSRYLFDKDLHLNYTNSKI